MLSIALRRVLSAALLTCVWQTAWTADKLPTTLRVPVLGLRYDLATTRFEPLPANLLGLCATLASDENMRGVFWIYASTRQAARNYYVIGGYGVRAQPEPPDFPRYEPLDLGTVLAIDNQGCTVFGEAREVFQTRYFDEIPQPVLQRLADDLASRLTLALGGKARLAVALRRQRLSVDGISPELSKAFGSVK